MSQAEGSTQEKPQVGRERGVGKGLEAGLQEGRPAKGAVVHTGVRCVARSPHASLAQLPS